MVKALHIGLKKSKKSVKKSTGKIYRKIIEKVTQKESKWRPKWSQRVTFGDKNLIKNQKKKSNGLKIFSKKLNHIMTQRKRMIIWKLI